MCVWRPVSYHQDQDMGKFGGTILWINEWATETSFPLTIFKRDPIWVEDFGQKHISENQGSIWARGNLFSGINKMKWTRAVSKLWFFPYERKSRASYLQKPPSKSSLENQLWELGERTRAEIRRRQRGFLPPPGGESHCSLSPWPPGAPGAGKGRPLTPSALPPGLRASGRGFLLAAPVARPDTGRGRQEGQSAKRLRDAEGYISPRIIIITHTPIEPRLPDKQKAVPRRGGAEAEVTLGVNFGTLLNWLEKKKKGNSICACKPRQTNWAAAGRPAGRSATREGSSEEGREGVGGWQGSQAAVPPPPPPGTRHSSRPPVVGWSGWGRCGIWRSRRSRDRVLSKHGCFLDSHQVLLLLRFRSGLSFC